MKYISHNNKKTPWLIRLTAFVLCSVSAGSVVADQTNTTYSALPEISQRKAADPMVLLNLSLDHQLFIKAYNDYDDIVGADGKPYAPGATKDEIADITYQDGYNYVGYFDYTKCYTYDTEVFSANTNAMDSGTHFCSAGGWSGNFLNWATMTRIDLVRSALYGGYRSTDTATSTVLERAYLPQDSHSFAKYLKDQDLINKLTDLDGENNVDCSSTGVTDKKTCGFTFCNTSQIDTTGYSHQPVSAASKPLMRVAKGNYSLWATGERYQCALRTAGEVTTAGYGTNNNNPEFSGIDAYPDIPTATQTDFVVRVNACDSNSRTGTPSQTCTPYADSSYKPTGILHTYGKDKNFQFGLLTGSYESSKSFGTLRKNVSSFREEVKADGTFAKDDITDSIIKNIDALRLVGYSFSARDNQVEGTYNKNCEWHSASFNNGECPNWGNPFSELLAQSYRYFAGGSEILAADDTAAGSLKLAARSGRVFLESELADAIKVTKAEWQPDFACSNMNVLGFNASAVSFDSDELTKDSSVSYALGLGVNFPGGDQTLGKLMESLDAEELGPVNDRAPYFVGESGLGTDDKQCTAKAITSLADVKGTCPEAPKLEGGFLGAGLAHFVHTNDIDTSDLEDGKQTISTYGVDLAGNLPKITARVPTTSPDTNRVVTIVPACRFYDGLNVNGQGDSTQTATTALIANFTGNCALVGFKPVIVQQSNTTEGKYLISWEDSEHGGDYDPDLTGIISYQVSENNLSITTQLLHQGAGGAMEFGYAISGTGNPALDGVHYPSQIVGHNGFALDQWTQTPECEARAASGNNPNCETQVTTATINNVANVNVGRTQIMNFTLPVDDSSVAGKFLESILYYASKWGSFDESESAGADVNDIPDVDNEWLKDNEPMSYAKVSDPARLSQQINSVFESLGGRPAPAAGAGVARNTSTSIGLYLQSLYHGTLEKKVAGQSASVEWIGKFNGLFLDEYSNRREDTNHDGVLDDQDLVVEFYVGGKPETTLARRYPLGQRDVAATLQEGVALSAVNYVWNATEQLEKFADAANGDQRSYSDPANTGRYIFTAIDKIKNTDGTDADGVGLIENSEMLAFTPDNVATIAPLLHMSDYTDTSDEVNLIDFIRGQEGIAGFRSRTLDGTPWLLGDIIHSRPVIIGRPSDGYDTVYSDPTYTDFRNYYRNRRKVVYVGANDGMLHAFNAGFTYVEGKIGFSADNKAADLTEAAPQKIKHPLGSELWAYVPYNLLPHLKWLAQEDYRHVYYMDGDVQSFDAKVFDEDTDHPGGWGTIIVAGMRFGGGDYNLDPDAYDGTNNITLRSGYVILDVTNPEKAPEIIAEVSDPELGYATSNVQVFKKRVQDLDEDVADSDVSEWYLVFGSGPKGTQSLEFAVSDGIAQIFSLDLKAALAGNPALVAMSTGVGGSDSFVGGVEVFDWNGDYIDDQVYFGLVGNPDSLTSPTSGQLMQAEIGSPNPNSNALEIATPTQVLTSTDYAFSSAPLAILDSNNKRWLFASTGRFYISDDAGFAGQNSTFGLIVGSTEANGDVNDYTPLNLANEVYDVTPLLLYVSTDGANKVVDKDGAPLKNDSVSPSTDITNLDQLNAYIVSQKGWVRDFRTEGEINFTGIGFLQDTLFVNSSDPDFSSSCSAGSTSRRYVWDMLNGMPQLNLEGDAVFTYNAPGNLDSAPPEDLLAGDIPADGVTEGVIYGEGLNGVSDSGAPPPAPPTFIKTPASRRSWHEIPLDQIN